MLLVLACPLGMLAIGGIAWLVARTRGEKKEFSMGCMQHGDHRQASREPEEAGLREEVSRLQAEVESLKAQLPGDRSAAISGAVVTRDVPDPN